MRLILFDGPVEARARFYPISLSRPVWELRTGITTLGEKIVAKVGAADVACFVPDYMAEVYKTKTNWKVNDPATLKGNDLLIIRGSVKAETLPMDRKGEPTTVCDCGGEVLWAWVGKDDLPKCDTSSLEALLVSARKISGACDCQTKAFKYVWELVLENPAYLAADFKAAGRSGIEGTVEQPNAIRGDKKDIFIGKGAAIHPMVVLDAEGGPIYLDEDVEVHPFTRIEGPCYVGKKSILLGAKCREGMSIGPVCRIGGEVEESVIQGYANKYHDGFLGHAYVGEWVNLGAMTTNSDLKNDYSSVSVIMDGKHPISTGSTKVGGLIGDHTKTSIAALFNTGAYVGAMCLIMASGKPLPKWIPSFAWMLDGLVTKGFGKKQLYATAAAAMPRRKKQWTPAEEAMWDAIYDLTKGPRDEAIKKGRKAMLRK